MSISPPGLGDVVASTDTKGCAGFVVQEYAINEKESGNVIYSPSDLIRYLASPFASWLDRYYLEHPGAIMPDEETEEQKLFSAAGGYKDSSSNFVEIAKDDCDFTTAHVATLEAINAA